MLQLAFLLLAVLPVHCQLNFTGHKLLALFASDEEELGLLKDLAYNSDVDVWNEPVALYEKVNVRVPPEVASHLESNLRSKGIDFYVVTNDLQKWIDEEREENPPDDELAGRQENFQLDVYHTFDAISAYIDSVPGRYPSLVSAEHIGTTFEGNPIKGLKIGSPGVNKPALWIDSGIHAREWVSPATSIYIIEQLVRGYDTDPEIKELVDTYDWYIFPVVNPDGYKYTWTFNRMWRKNRAVSRRFGTNPFCRGADPNRNFDSAFGGPGTSGDSCSEIYRGESAFSEAESQAIRDGVLRLGSRLKAYFTLHSYSQLWMTPYGHSRTNPPDHADHMKALQAAATAIGNVHGQYYRYGPIATTIYPAAGSSVDWAYEGAKVKYSFAIELRDTGRQGFLLSNTQIIPNAEENFAGIKAVAKLISNEL
ncbi:carboxypeptidase B-like [Stegodyphus dumicola]|uniref:carboxypeptidase B-like n=1 Tax=Stegodyphus dumicola TaxID=202533 RepID=UPI0015B0D5A6|nr:carboxypeptidase B-like [Stegodyphus dumicola]XP_035226655.1 carboxypeptidase B-like [Stegodyphus dumicola]XP_035226656.1 carboxypeptidase B-like [Stegodyphus dumicola]